MTSSSPERRRQPRRRTYIGATVRFAVLTGTMSCLIRNMSGTGARLELDQTYWLPGRFDIDIPHLDLRAPARVVWRSKTALGIAFEQTNPKFLQRNGGQWAENLRMTGEGQWASISAQSRIVSLEAERAKLQARVRQLTDEL
jgi:PilZ domain